MNRLPALDSIRGFAVLWVVLFHASNSLGHSSPYVRAVLAILQQGWLGVEIFFTLSGFLITRILLASKQQSAREFFGGFYWRRTLRIFPIYFLILGLLVVVPFAVTSCRRLAGIASSKNKAGSGCMAPTSDGHIRA